MTSGAVERRHHTASLVLRTVDAYRRARGRPTWERGPIRRVQLGLVGEVVGGAVQPLGSAAPVPIRNLSGDWVFRDLTLPGGVYRIALEGDARAVAEAVYEDLDPADRDVAWDPTGASRLVLEGRTHPSQFVEIPLYPTGPYPFPPESTLIRGALFWYDGTALSGAAVREPSAIIDRSRLGPRGDFVLAYEPAAATGLVDLQIDVSAVDPSQMPAGAAYLAAWPGSIAGIIWRRGQTVSVRQPALRGAVLAPDGIPARGAVISLQGQPGSVRAADDGGWRYHFPPGTPSGAVDVLFQHPDYADVTLAAVPITTDATTQVLTTRFA